MRRFTAVLILICIVLPTLFSLEVSGLAIEVKSGDWLYTVSSGKATITGYVGSMKAVSVPEILNGHEVTEIGSTAFYDSDIENIIFSPTVNKIGWWAFYGCKNLSNVTLNSGLKSIEYGAFMNCPKLSSIEIGSTVGKIGEDAFAVSCHNTLGVRDNYSKKVVSSQEYSTDFNFKIYGYSGTAAHRYAEDHNINFESSGELNFGDLDNDGAIDNRDIIVLRNYIEENDSLTSIQRLSADLNCDGSADEADLIMLTDYVNGRISYYSLPATAGIMPKRYYLYGKSLYSDGDSVAKGTGTNNFGSELHSYANYLSEKNYMSLTTKAVGGTTLARQRSKTKNSNKSILERVLEMDGNYDVILLDGGFNDLFRKIDVGTVTPISDKSGKYDEYTTAGALESICYFLNKNYSDSVKLFVLCHEKTDDSAQDYYWDIIKDVLNKWEIPYIDFREETDFSNSIPEINNQYFAYNEENGKGDGTHPLAYAQDKIYGSLIEEKLLELFEEKNSLGFSHDVVYISRNEEITEPLFNNGELYMGEIEWISSDRSIARVENGKVIAEGLGTAVIRAESADGRMASFEVRVKGSPLCVYLNKTELEMDKNEKFKLVAEFFEGSASYNNIFSSSNESVAEVSQDGVITAKGNGTAVITCKTVNGVKTQCVVNVK